MTTTVDAYRKENRRSASAWLAAAIVTVTIAAGYSIAQAARIGNAGPMSSVTSRAIHRSVQRLVDNHLAEARLKLLMGISPSSGMAAQQATLDGLLKGAGLAKPRDPSQTNTSQSDTAQRDGAAAFIVATVTARGRELTEALAPLVRVASLNTLRTRLRDEPASDDQRLARVELAVSEAIPVMTTENAFKAWADRVAGDAAVSTAWTLVRAANQKEGFAEILSKSLPANRVRPLVAKQLAADFLVSWSGAGDDALSARDLTARFAWGTAAVLFVGLWIVAVMISAWQIWTLLPAGRAGLTAWISVGVAAGAGALVFNWPAISPHRIELFGPVLSGLEADLGTNVILASRVLTAMAAAALVMLFVGAWSSVWQDVEELLETQLDSLRLIFNVGAAALVAGTLQVAALYSWAATVMQAAGSDDTIAKTALTAAGFAGAVFSVVLLAIYLVPATVLKQRAKRAEADDEDIQTQAAQVAQQAVGDSPSQKLLVLLQALAPLLAAIPMSGLLALLSQ